MPKKFTLVVGDAGGAIMLVPVAERLAHLGHTVNFIADAKGMAPQVLREHSSLPQRICEEADQDAISLAEQSDVVVINTCSSATTVEKGMYVALTARTARPVIVFSADGFFNHAYKWSGEQPDYWCAINEAHAVSICSLRPDLSPERVVVVGQPAFDPCLDLIPKKEEIWAQVRRRLEIGAGETVFLWYSAGLSEVIEEDVAMALAAIRTLPKLVSRPVFIAKIHPKLDKIHAGYVAEIESKVSSLCEMWNVRYLLRPVGTGEELDLASDVILSATATDDIKNWIMGGPPVVHMIGPAVRRWFEEGFKLTPPDYLPDVVAGEALRIGDPEDWKVVLQTALDPDEQKRLRKNWRPPTEKSTDRMVNALLKIAR